MQAKKAKYDRNKDQTTLAQAAVAAGVGPTVEAAAHRRADAARDARLSAKRAETLRIRTAMGHLMSRALSRGLSVTDVTHLLHPDFLALLDQAREGYRGAVYNTAKTHALYARGRLIEDLSEYCGGAPCTLCFDDTLLSSMRTNATAVLLGSGRRSRDRLVRMLCHAAHSKAADFLKFVLLGIASVGVSPALLIATTTDNASVNTAGINCVHRFSAGASFADVGLTAANFTDEDFNSGGKRIPLPPLAGECSEAVQAARVRTAQLGGDLGDARGKLAVAHDRRYKRQPTRRRGG